MNNANLPDGGTLIPIGYVVKPEGANSAAQWANYMSVKGFGGRLFRARLELQAKLGRTVVQAEIGKLLGVSAATVSRWELGQKEPPLARIELIAAALGIPAGLLAFGPEGLEVQTLQDVKRRHREEDPAHASPPPIRHVKPTPSKRRRKRA